MISADRAVLLDALAKLANEDTESLDPLTTFLPLPAHRRALSDEVVVVLGGRGAGKTALFKLVNDPKGASRLRAFFESDRIPEATWIDAFSQANPRHPEVGTLEAHAAGASDITLRTFWMAHLLRRVNEEVPGIATLPPHLEVVLTAPAADVAAWLPAAEAGLGAINASLDAVDRELQRRDRSVVAAYDNLDRIGQFDPAIRRRYVSTLLSLWLSLSSRYRRLRGKVFLRDDLFDAGELGFADATKLRPRSESITWDHTALYRVALRHLANPSDTANAEAIRAWIGEIPDLILFNRGEFGWMPGDLSDKAQQFFAGRLAGKVIGKGVLKSYTSRWLTGRLQDSLGRITPRSMLWFLGFAAEEARRRPPARKGTLISPDALLSALRRTSIERVSEIREEYDLVSRIENLRGMTIPLERASVVKHLGTPRAQEPVGIPARGEMILSELMRLGVLKSGKEGQIDIPDIYRYSFEIAPDYATAWKDFLTDDNDLARQQIERELPILGEILRRDGGDSKWSSVGADEIGRKDYTGAIKKCERALDLLQSANDQRGEIDVLFQLYSINIEQKDFSRANQYAQRALELSRRVNDPKRELQALQDIGLEKARIGDFDQAVFVLEEALRIAQAQKNHPEETTCWLYIGTINGFRGHSNEANECLKKAMAAGQAASDRFSEIRAWKGMILFTARREQDVSILKLATLALILAKKAGNFSASYFSTEQVAATTRLGYGPDRLEQIRREMEEEYKKDRGWSLIQSIFPSKPPT